MKAVGKGLLFRSSETAVGAKAEEASHPGQERKCSGEPHEIAIEVGENSRISTISFINFNSTQPAAEHQLWPGEDG